MSLKEILERYFDPDSDDEYYTMMPIDEKINQTIQEIGKELPTEKKIVLILVKEHYYKSEPTMGDYAHAIRKLFEKKLC